MCCPLTLTDFFFFFFTNFWCSHCNVCLKSNGASFLLHLLLNINQDDLVQTKTKHCLLQQECLAAPLFFSVICWIWSLESYQRHTEQQWFPVTWRRMLISSPDKPNRNKRTCIDILLRALKRKVIKCISPFILGNICQYPLSQWLMADPEAVESAQHRNRNLSKDRLLAYSSVKRWIRQ